MGEFYLGSHVVMFVTSALFTLVRTFVDVIDRCCRR